MFLTLMVIGLVGLLVMAVPAFARHGGVGHGHGAVGHGHGHGVHGVLHAKSALTDALAKHSDAGAALTPAGPTRFIPSPRLVFSVLALYGAFGNALERAFH